MSKQIQHTNLMCIHFIKNTVFCLRSSNVKYSQCTVTVASSDQPTVLQLNKCKVIN